MSSSSCVRLSPVTPSGVEPVVMIPPGSKSHTTRAMVLNHLVGDAVELQGCSDASDATVLAGLLARFREGGGGVLDAEDGGAPARFAIALAALTPGRWEITGNDRLKSRPFNPLLEALRHLGVDIAPGEGLPALVNGGNVDGAEVRIDAALSSQFVSALMLVAPLFRNGLILCGEDLVSRPYVELTLDVLRGFGVKARGSFGPSAWKVEVEPGIEAPGSFAIHPDASGAGYLWGIGAMTDRGVHVPLSRDGSQPDIALIDIFEQMGASVSSGADGTVVRGPLQKGGIFDLGGFPDSAPMLAVAAATVRGETEIVGVPHLAHKESNRIESLVEGLTGLGVRASARSDGLVIGGCPTDGLNPEVRIDPQDDHRIAMAFGCLGAVLPVGLKNPGCCRKSFPGFLDAISPFVMITPDEEPPYDVS